MSKLIAGFLLGVIATIAVFYLVEGKPFAKQEMSTDQSELTEKAADRERTNAAINIDKMAKEEDEELNRSATFEPVSEAEPLALQAKPVVTRPPDISVPGVAQRPSARTTNNDYPPEIADMIENSVDKKLQAQYESDEREESWATYMEGQLAAYFAQKPEIAQFNFSLIDCRTSICEVHALGYGPDAMTFWNTATADIATQTWHDFQSMSMNHHNPQPDILGIVLILSKKAE